MRTGGEGRREGRERDQGVDQAPTFTAITPPKVNLHPIKADEEAG